MNRQWGNKVFLHCIYTIIILPSWVRTSLTLVHDKYSRFLSVFQEAMISIFILAVDHTTSCIRENDRPAFKQLFSLYRAYYLVFCVTLTALII